ncbi:MAG: hypothetical protein A2491_10270 [Bacteroidetes bacterium RIFOXYC12_FULL_35_7]|nr:MAG: hypothetical protein A2491_10270 [Bacteroidetes bacterium RIFOXYC12_FULL_35_7]
MYYITVFLFIFNVIVMKKIFILLGTLAFFAFQANSQCFFNKIYDTYLGAFNVGLSVIQTFDGGFIAVGGSNITQTTEGTYILKVNACGDISWQKIYELSSDNGGNNGNSIVQLHDSSYVICGSMYDSTENASDGFLLKLNKVGDSLWFKHIDAGYNDRAIMHKQTPDGGFIIGGYFNVPKGKVFLVKTDNLGNVQWEKQYTPDTIQQNFTRSIDITYDNGYIISGTFFNSTNNSWDNFLLKTDGLGDQVWFKAYGDSHNESMAYVVATLDSGYVISGGRYQTSTDCDSYIIKTDKYGNVQWERTYGILSYFDNFKSVKQLLDSSYIVGGSIKDTIHTPNRSRIRLIKLNTQGYLVWKKNYTYYGGGYQYGGVADDYLEDLNLTNDNGFIICGYIINNFMPGQNDLLLIKTDSLGNTCQIDTNTYAGCSYQECNYTHAVFSVLTDTIDLQFIDTIHFYNQSSFAQQWFWDFDDGQTDTVQNPLHVFDTIGTYNVMLVASLNECSDTVYKTVVVVNSVGIKSVESANIYATIYPNPNNGIMQLEYSFNNGEDGELVIISITGKEIARYKLNNKNGIFNIPETSLSQGIYFYKVVSGGEIIATDKLVIIR